jgi:hypothetical protein
LLSLDDEEECEDEDEFAEEEAAEGASVESTGNLIIAVTDLTLWGRGAADKYCGACQSLNAYSSCGA